MGNISLEIYTCLDDDLYLMILLNNCLIHYCKNMKKTYRIK